SRTSSKATSSQPSAPHSLSLACRPSASGSRSLRRHCMPNTSTRCSHSCSTVRSCSDGLSGLPRTQNAPTDPVGAFARRGGSDDGDVGRLRALLALGDVELHLRALGEGLEARAVDRGEVHEDVVAVLALDEAEALV